MGEDLAARWIVPPPLTGARQTDKNCLLGAWWLMLGGWLVRDRVVEIRRQADAVVAFVAMREKYERGEDAESSESHEQAGRRAVG